MSKRTPGLERRKHDKYLTPYHGVVPLLAHLEPGTRFLEPCAGDGRLIGYLQEHGHVCEGAWDIAPQDPCIRELDALYLVTGVERAKFKIITNPPWTRELLHPMITHFTGQHDTWLLFDADWCHTIQAAPYLPFCERIVSAGRIRWLEGDPADRGHSPKDNCAWHLFTDKRGPGPIFCGRE